MPISGVGVTSTFIGGIMVYSAVKGKSIGDVARNVIAGKDPANASNTLAIVTGTAILPGSSVIAATDGLAQNTSQDPGGSPAQNQAIAKLLSANYGWNAGPQWDALVKLWQQESSWDNTAVNSIGATGIPQALPATKLPVSGQAPTFNASAQISWGLDYIKGRYGSPLAAWQHETQFGWY